ncbi:MAG: glycosyltransferase family 9 protein [Kiritimatiellaeota bacterium]|nr:glycosyltransferase family 9 protein [Kiritimatiellota bacterium]
MLAPLKQKFPQAEIHLLIHPGGVELFSRDSRVTCAHGFDFPWVRRASKFDSTKPVWSALFRCMRDLRALRFDIGVDARGEVRNQILMLLIGCRRRVGATNYLCSNMRIRGRLLTDSLGDVPLKHRTQINFDLCAALGCEVDRNHFLPALEWPAQKAHEEFTVLMHTGAGWRFRLWPENNWTRLIQRIVSELRVRVRIVGSPDEQPRLEAIRRGLPEGSATFLRTTFGELIDEIKSCDLMIALDSGPMHIATMLGKPVIALFGPGIVPMYEPISPGSSIVHHQSVYDCAPCAQKNICLHPQNNCVASISVHEVFNPVREQVAALRLEAMPNCSVLNRF